MTVYCVDCGEMIEADVDTKMDGLEDIGIEAHICESCLMNDSE